MLEYHLLEIEIKEIALSLPQGVMGLDINAVVVFV
ncbi:hypothetical protein PMIT1303_01591 [Prochlorococcus sp. MIT 1303]|nr:hypothetical protein PMIT1303_01591 [Prochlorococcus sp. MIT 1303]